MKLILSTPSTMNVEVGKAESGEFAVLTPVRYTNAQQTIPLIPFVLKNEKGAVLHAGCISVRTKGKLVVETRMSSVPFDCDKEA
jgi:hypothetical protein